MQVKVHSIQFSADQKLVDFINQKVNKLNLFFGNIVDSEVFLKIITPNSNNNKLVEIKINVPGKELFDVNTADKVYAQEFKKENIEKIDNNYVAA